MKYFDSTSITSDIPIPFGFDFLFFLPEVFIALSLSSVLVFGACVHQSVNQEKKSIFRDVVSSLIIFVGLCALGIFLFSP
jgi:hypothetical protein